MMVEADMRVILLPEPGQFDCSKIIVAEAADRPPPIRRPTRVSTLGLPQPSTLSSGSLVETSPSAAIDGVPKERGGQPPVQAQRALHQGDYP
jgi:hypothetical protein